MMAIESNKDAIMVIESNKHSKIKGHFVATFLDNF